MALLDTVFGELISWMRLLYLPLHFIVSVLLGYRQHPTNLRRIDPGRLGTSCGGEDFSGFDVDAIDGVLSHQLELPLCRKRVRCGYRS